MKPEVYRFVADTMVGKLARWLRVLGYDTLYFHAIDDPALVRISLAEDRWLLTRDARLINDHTPPKYILIRHDHLEDQLRQVVQDLQLSTDRDSGMRCLVCNRLLVDLPRRDARSRVPAYVYQTQGAFVECPGCRRIYWQGTHFHRMSERLDRIFRSTPHAT